VEVAVGRDEGLRRVVGRECAQCRSCAGDHVVRDPVRGVERGQCLRLLVQEEHRVVAGVLVVQPSEQCSGLTVDVWVVLVRGPEGEVPGDAFQHEDAVLLVRGDEGTGVPAGSECSGGGAVSVELAGEVRVGRAGGLHGEAVVASADVQDPRVEEPPRLIGHDDGIGERLLHERDLVVVESGVPPVHGGTLPSCSDHWNPSSTSR
jgi:hypothetical protein